MSASRSSADMQSVSYSQEAKTQEAAPQKQTRIQNRLMTRLRGISDGIASKVSNTARKLSASVNVNQETQNKLKDNAFKNQSKKSDVLYQKEFVCQKIVKKLGNDPKKAIKIVKDLCDSNDVRFNHSITGNQGSFSFDKDAILSELEKMNNQTQQKTDQVATQALNTQHQDSSEVTHTKNEQNEVTYTEKEKKW